MRQARHWRAVRGIEKCGSAIHESDEFGPAPGIARRELADRIPCPCRISVDRQALAVAEQADVGRARAGRVDAQSKFLDDIRPQLRARMQRVDRETVAER